MNQSQKKIRERVKRFFEISSLKCAHCGELGCVHIKNGDVEATIQPEYYDIYSIEDWERKMDEGFDWIFSNKEEVLEILPTLEEEWAKSCEALKEVINAKIRQEASN